MSDPDELHQTLALVARGVQRMADSFGAVEERLAELDRLAAISDRIDEYRVRNRTELQQIVDRLDRLEQRLTEAPTPSPSLDEAAADNLADVVAALRGELAEHLAALDGRTPGATETADVSRLTDAVRALRDDLATATSRIEDRIPEAAPTPTPPPVDLDPLTDAVRALRDDLATATAQLAERIAVAPTLAPAEPTEAPPAPEPVDLDPLTDAVRALRDDLATATTRLQAETTATVERAATEQGARLAQLRDAVAALRDALAELPAAAGPTTSEPSETSEDEVRTLVAEVRDALQAVHGEIVAGSGQLRTDLAAELAPLRDKLDEATNLIRADIASATAPIDEPDAGDPMVPRLQAIEAALTHLRDDLAIDRLETSMRHMGGELERVSSDTTDLRNDVKRSFDRVLNSITAAEDSVKGEIKAIDNRIGGMADDLRLVRGLRDGLEALASGVDAVRQLTSKSATSQQMGELGRDLTTLLAEIESARSQVLAVDQHVASQPSDAIDVRPEIQRLERAVGEDVDELGKRIEQLANAVEAQASKPDAPPPDVTDAIATRLRSLATGARQLGLGISEDLKSRNKRKKPAKKR
ncbi:MAG TPA: hypothetical protein VEA78_03100 [Acidimicrobiales bacterium]|nr:hypothetical protein [Acidimicrobiales bacterium]